MDDVEIVHIAPVMAALQGPFHVFVQHIEVNIAEKLRSQVADRQADTGRRFQQAFGGRQPVPFRKRADDAAIFDRVAQQNRADQEIHQVAIEPYDIFRPPGAVPIDRTPNNRVKQPLVDAHKITAQIELQDVSRSRVVVRATAHMMLEALDAQRGSFPFTTGITVINHPTFEQRRQIIEQQVMHHPVTERRGENLPLDGTLRNETDARRRPIRPIPDLLVQYDQIMLQIHLEGELALGVAFMFSRIVIGPEDIGQ